VFVGCNSELVVKAVMPDFFHISPIINNTVFDRVAQFKNSLLGLSLISDVGFFVHSNHDVFVFGSSNNWGEWWSRGIISRETCFTHSWSIVNNDGCSLLITHYLWIKLWQTINLQHINYQQILYLIISAKRMQ